MGEIVLFPQRHSDHRAGCARWRRGPDAIALTARPACAALALALADTPRIATDGVVKDARRQDSATIVPMAAARASR